MNVSTVRQWVMHFSIGDNDGNNNPYSITVKSLKTEHLNQLFCLNLAKKRSAFSSQQHHHHHCYVKEGHLHWCRYFWIWYAGYCLLLAKMHSQWCYLCGKMFCSWKLTLSYNSIVIHVSVVIDFHKCGRQAVVQHWQKCIVKGVNYTEKNIL